MIFSKKEVNFFKLIKSARKDHHCYASDEKQEESRRKEIDEIFNKIKYIREGSKINKRSPYILYSKNNFDI